MVPLDFSGKRPYHEEQEWNRMRAIVVFFVFFFSLMAFLSLSSPLSYATPFQDLSQHKVAYQAFNHLFFKGYVDEYPGTLFEGSGAPNRVKAAFFVAQASMQYLERKAKKDFVGDISRYPDYQDYRALLTLWKIYLPELENLGLSSRFIRNLASAQSVSWFNSPPSSSMPQGAIASFSLTLPFSKEKPEETLLRKVSPTLLDVTFPLTRVRIRHDPFAKDNFTLKVLGTSIPEFRKTTSSALSSSIPLSSSVREGPKEMTFLRGDALSWGITMIPKKPVSFRSFTYPSLSGPLLSTRQSDTSGPRGVTILSNPLSELSPGTLEGFLSNPDFTSFITKPALESTNLDVLQMTQDSLSYAFPKFTFTASYLSLKKKVQPTLSTFTLGETYKTSSIGIAYPLSAKLTLHGGYAVVRTSGNWQGKMNQESTMPSLGATYTFNTSTSITLQYRKNLNSGEPQALLPRYDSRAEAVLNLNF